MDRVRTLVKYRDINKYKQYLGRGVHIAIFDTGIIWHPDLERNIRGFHDFIGHRPKAYDAHGHGTHIAGIIAGNGSLSNGKYAGIAPAAQIHMLKVLDHKGDGKVAHILEGMSWLRKNHEKHNIKIANISVGTYPSLGDKENEWIIKGVESLWDAGIVVVTAAGNYGPREGTITVPGVSEKVITVGAVDDQIYVNKRGEVKHNYSGRGPTLRNICKPDILAPGSYIKSCNNKIGKKQIHPYTVKSGTSMSTPVVTGAVALLLEKYPELTNEEVKRSLCETAVDLKRPLNEQGAGLLNIEALLSL
ncbi:MAG: S8 family peptidase [Eubacteriales bacterium]